MKKKILITDATSKVGIALVAHLLEQGGDYDIKALCLDKHNMDVWADKKVESCLMTSLDMESLESHIQGIHIIYHLVDYMSADKKEEDTVFAYNFLLTKRIVDLSIKHSIEKLLFFSSTIHLYDKHSQALLTEEINELPEDADAYGKSKYLAEIEVYRAMAEGVNAIIVSPSLMLEESAILSDAKLIKKVAQDKKANYGHIGYVWMKDVVTLMYKLMESKLKNDKFIISAENVSTRELCICLNAYHQHITPDQKKKRAKQKHDKESDRLDYFLTHLAHQNCGVDNQKIKSHFRKFFFTTLADVAASIA